MRTKILLQTLAFVFATLFASFAQRNPYEEIGKKAEVLTLSKGEYEEFFDDEDIQQIGTSLINIRTGKIVKLLTKEESEKRLESTMGERFLSVDPLTSKFPMLTPYQYASNTPIQAIDLDGLEASIVKQADVFFIKLKNVDVSFIIRQSEKNFTQSAISKNSNLTDISINTQQYEASSTTAQIKYGFGPTSPQPSSDYRAQGYTIDKGSKMAGRSSPQTFYFSQSAENCSWTCAQGDVPQDSYRGFGGGIPVLVDGLKYGDKNIYSKNAPSGLPEVGDPGAENRKYLLQRSNSGYASQNDESIGKTVVGFNSKTNEWTVVVQPNNVKGLSLDAIRDKLISQGNTSILSFDGSTSSTLVQDNKILVSPTERKNNTITTGATFTVPNQ